MKAYTIPMMAKIITMVTTTAKSSSSSSSDESDLQFEDLVKHGKSLLEDGDVEQCNMSPKTPTSAKNTTTPEAICLAQILVEILLEVDTNILYLNRSVKNAILKLWLPDNNCNGVDFGRR